LSQANKYLWAGPTQETLNTCGRAPPLKKRKNKKNVDGYYFDGKNSFTLYKDKNGKSSMKKRGKK